MKLSEKIRRVFETSCGDEKRQKGCWTARGEYHLGGRMCASLTPREELALKEKRCICDHYIEEREVLKLVEEMEEKIAQVIRLCEKPDPLATLPEDVIEALE